MATMEPRGGSALYSAEMLALAVSLADWPIDDRAACSADVRSPTCGSSLRFACNFTDGRIERPGLRVTACAVGQAAAALFVAAADGRSREQIETAREEIARWLGHDGPLPNWPGFQAIEAARGYPGRHGAILLAWNAALAALPKETAPG